MWLPIPMLIIPHVAWKINDSACNLIRKCIKLGSKQLNKVNIQYVQILPPYYDNTYRKILIRGKNSFNLGFLHFH